MKEYLEKNYVKKTAKRSRRKEKSNIKIFDSEEETNKNISRNNVKKDELSECEFEYAESDKSFDIPVIVTENNTNEIIQLSDENKKKIIESLKSDFMISSSEEKNEIKKSEKYHFKNERKQKERENMKNMLEDDVYKNNKNKESNNNDNNNKSNKHFKDKMVSSERSDSDSDLSVPRNKRSKSDSNSSIPRKKKDTYESDSDLSIPRNIKCSKNKKDTSINLKSENNSKENSELEHSDSNTSLSLSSRRKNKELQYAPSRNLKNEEINSTIYRDKDGKIITREKWIDKQKSEMKSIFEKNKKNRKKKKNDFIKLEWGSGLVQEEIRKRNIEENEKLINKRNIVNYDYDSDYDLELKKKKRKEDPMNIYLDEKKENQKPTCRYQTPYNRFNILAGYRWDGVIRGNGFEQKMLEALKLKQQQNKLAYMNNTSDM